MLQWLVFLLLLVHMQKYFFQLDSKKWYPGYMHSDFQKMSVAPFLLHVFAHVVLPGTPHPGWTNPPSFSGKEPAWGLGPGGQHGPHCWSSSFRQRAEKVWNRGKSKRPGRAANTGTILVCLHVN